MAISLTSNVYVGPYPESPNAYGRTSVQALGDLIATSATTAIAAVNKATTLQRNAVTVQPVTNTFAIDFSLGDTFILNVGAATGNITVSFPTNVPTKAVQFNILFVQGSTARTVTFTGAYKNTPTLTASANAQDFVEAIYLPATTLPTTTAKVICQNTLNIA